MLTQHFLKVLYITLRKMYKVKWFFRILDLIIKEYPLLRRQFKLFRIILAGKITGGTKRRKLYSIGYGRLIIQTLSERISTNFKPFDHVFGEFGIKVYMIRRTRIDPTTETRMLRDA